jgi:hypothetical protein
VEHAYGMFMKLIYLFKLNLRLRACLLSSCTLQNSAGHYSYFFNLIFTFFNNNQHQNILTFFIFYITSIIFYYYSNKKIHYNINFFHFLLISKLTTHYSVLLCSLPNKP